jgi:dTDP-glucose pyrophosphorylase
MDYKNHLIHSGTVIKDVLNVLDRLAQDAICFVLDSDSKLLGSVTDGDIRRGLIAGAKLNDAVERVYNPNPKFIIKGGNDINEIIALRDGLFELVPIVNAQFEVIDVINLRDLKSYLPLDVVIMAGGRGSRLLPLTETVPKPLLNIGDKPILDHNIRRLSQFGIEDLWISVNYLGHKVVDYFGDGEKWNLNIRYVWENEPLGTIGAVSKINDFGHDYILVANSDLLTNIDYEDLFLRFEAEDADLAVVTIPYKVDVPYAVLETVNGHVIDFKEKPSYTYYSNGGIYLMKRDIVDYIPQGVFYNSTDLLADLIRKEKNIFSYPLSGYWLDIGNPDDYKKAQEDIKTIKF